MIGFEDGPEQYDFRESEEEDSLPIEMQQTIEHLRETLTYDMALAAYRNRLDEEPEDDEDLEAFMESLIADAVNAGCEDWSEYPIGNY